MPELQGTDHNQCLWMGHLSFQFFASSYFREPSLLFKLVILFIDNLSSTTLLRKLILTRPETAIWNLECWVN